MAEPTQYLKIPIEGDDIAASARNLRKHLALLQKLALDNTDPDYIRKGELMAIREVITLMMHLEEIEENAPIQSNSPP